MTDLFGQTIKPGDYLKHKYGIYKVEKSYESQLKLYGKNGTVFGTTKNEEYVKINDCDVNLIEDTYSSIDFSKFDQADEIKTANDIATKTAKSIDSKRRRKLRKQVISGTIILDKYSNCNLYLGKHNDEHYYIPLGYRYNTTLQVLESIRTNNHTYHTTSKTNIILPDTIDNDYNQEMIDVFKTYYARENNNNTTWQRQSKLNMAKVFGDLNL